MKLNLFILVLMAGLCLQSAAPAETIQVFLQGGQSNCVGNADKSGLPAELQSPQTDVPFYFGASPTQQNIDLLDSELQWIDLQVDSGYDFGPEILFGRTMADALSTPDNQVAIIKSGLGGTGFVTGDPYVWYGGGDATTTGDGNAYQDFQSTVSSGMASLAAAHPSATIEIVGMIWIQGEQDAINEPGDYETDLTAFFADIRLTYGADLPIVITQLCDNQTAIPTAGLNTVKAAQANIAAADSLIEMVVTDGLTMIPRGAVIHYDAPSMIYIGTQLASKMLNLLGVPYGVCTNPPAEDITGPEGTPDCRVDFYDFTAFAANWMASGTGGGSGGSLTSGATPPTDVIASGVPDAGNYTKIFADGARPTDDNEGRGNEIIADSGTLAGQMMTALVIRKDAAQNFTGTSATLTLYVFEGTKEDWDTGDGQGDGDLWDTATGTDFTDTVYTETFALDGTYAEGDYVTLTLTNPITMAADMGFFIKMAQGNAADDNFRIAQLSNPPASVYDVEGQQYQSVTADNKYVISPLEYYVVGTEPLIGDLSGPTGQPDCEVDIYDLVALSAAWLDCGLEPAEFCGP